MLTATKIEFMSLQNLKIITEFKCTIISITSDNYAAG